MNISLNESIHPAPNATVTSSLELKSTEKTASEGLGFGQWMSEQWPTPSAPPALPPSDDATALPLEGQAVADLGAIGVSPWAWTHPAALQAITLGPHLNVITAQSPPPDGQSLEAFARSQGLDDQAVHWLFGGTAGLASAMSDPTPTQSPLLTEQAALHNAAVLTATPSTNGGTEPMLNSDTHVLTAKPVPTVLQTSAISGTTSIETIATPTDPATAWVLAGAQAIWRLSDEALTAKGPAAGTTEGAEDGVPLNLFRMPPPAAVWVQRQALANLTAVTPTKGAEISTSELDLGEDWTSDLLNQLQSVEGSAPNGASTTGTHGSAYANFAARWDAMASLKADANQATPVPNSESAARSETIQNLADKMGHAVGQRILSELEKGQWHLKLQLRPATLGHIEVEMRMRSGEFDAVFTAPNALTRDLLQDGLAKLKDTLGQMGMDVASIHVQDGQTGRGGGNSTPGSFGGTPTKEAAPQGTPAEKPPVQQVKKPSDGLDILV